LKRFLGFALLLCLARAAHASSAKIWVTDTTREFSAGTAHGVSAEPTGDVVLARRSAKVEGIRASTILSAFEEAKGAIIVGTGDGGQVFRAEPGKPAVLLATVPEKEVTAVSVGPDGAVYAGTSPKGKVYRIDGGKASPYFDPQAEYVWALAFGPDGGLFVGTGIPGKIFRVASGGQGTTYFDSIDEHVRCLHVDRKGRLWAGTASRGLLLRFDGKGKAQTLYDSQRSEVSSIAEDRSGNVFAAAVSGHAAPPPAGPSRPTPPSTTAPKEKKPEPSSPDEGNATVTVTVSASPMPPPPPGPGPRGGENSEIVQISPDDSVTTVWQSDEDLVYSCAYDETDGGLLLGTGPKGRLYSLHDGQLALAESFDEKRILVVLRDALVTDSPPNAYRRVATNRGEYFSPIKDTGRTSHFGAFRSESTLPAKSSIEFSFRSGNSSLPDATWSDWSAPVAAARLDRIPAPPGRFLQWRAALESPQPGSRPSLARVECAYRNQNARPRVDNISVGLIAPRDIGSVPPASTDRDAGETIFTSADERPPGGSSASRWENRGFLIVSWKATDPDGDELSADIDFRPEGAARWVSMRKDVRGSSFGFDSTLVPDGRYQFRVTVSDSASNPEDPKTDSKESDPILIDNTPPRIEILPLGRESGRPVVHVRVTDASSPLSAVLWSVNAGNWSRADADDGMTDSPSESYTIRLSPEAHGSYLLIRALDAAGNSASASVAVP
jgi:hypothetical protein